jgi:isochorismate synthase
VHLRSDFNFVLEDTRRIGELIRALHPTPAVCGLPKQQTFDFIRRNESQSRRYYSGFSGPFNPEVDTHLFVSLRCMQILDDCYCLYTAGGLLRDSEEDQEWEETEAKLETMRSLLETK